MDEIITLDDLPDDSLFGVQQQTPVSKSQCINSAVKDSIATWDIESLNRGDDELYTKFQRFSANSSGGDEVQLNTPHSPPTNTKKQAQCFGQLSTEPEYSDSDDSDDSDMEDDDGDEGGTVADLLRALQGTDNTVQINPQPEVQEETPAPQKKGPNWCVVDRRGKVIEMDKPNGEPPNPNDKIEVLDDPNKTELEMLVSQLPLGCEDPANDAALPPKPTTIVATKGTDLDPASHPTISKMPTQKESPLRPETFNTMYSSLLSVISQYQ
eukprot:TRINITY_DN68029_c10_g10_i1.p1 TRINITY_DN68029_c10_g10~~TRINITY_DN68029_c10_g10_i1.p1  ORF type:complete len:278 (+),score=40.34 TRINITY_DN68029_c10_g10_i1:32-835(+)